MLFLLLACASGPVLTGGGQAPPLAADADVLRILVTGDSGEGNIPHYRVGLAMAEHCAAKADDRGPGCHFAVLLGDNVYPEGVTSADDEQWDTKLLDPFRPLGDLPLVMILGNHDYGDPPWHRENAQAMLDGAARYPNLVLPQAWYTLDTGPARFVALDSNAVMMGWTHQEQAAWATEQLDAVTDRWRIVLAHHPFRSNGQHGNAGEYEGTRNIPVASGARVERFYDQVLCDRADLLLTGHEHNRQWLEPVCGVELAIAGSGAKTTPLIDRGNPTLFQEDRERGFIWIELTADTLRAEVVDEWSRVDFVREIRRE